MASRIGVATGLSVICCCPKKRSMLTATGNRIITTTTFGRKMDSSVEATSQTHICSRIDVPKPQRLFIAKRLSRCVFSHTRLIRSLPTSSTTISEKYLLIIPSIGTMPKIAFSGIGSNEVTAIFTGRSTHQSPIQKIVAIAAACLNSITGASISRTSRKSNGPDKTFNERCFFINNSFLSEFNSSFPSIFAFT